MNPANLWWLSCEAYKKRWTFIARLLKTLNFVLFKAILPYQADIQRDIQLDHYGMGIVMHPNITIGHRVRIYHQVTLAAETWVGSEHRIFIGDVVTIGAGAIIVGRTNQSLFIGNQARIGAGSVVTRDVASGHTVVGSPARPVAGSKPDHGIPLSETNIKTESGNP